MKSEMHMSNLKLPLLTYVNLDKILTRRSRVKLAYATEAMRQAHSIALIHHNSVIAEIFEDGTVKLDTNGYDSVTTTGRLHKVLIDNEIGFKVGIRQREAWLLTYDCAKLRPLTTGTFRRGLIVEINGEKIGG